MLFPLVSPLYLPRESSLITLQVFSSGMKNFTWKPTDSGTSTSGMTGVTLSAPEQIGRLLKAVTADGFKVLHVYFSPILQLLKLPLTLLSDRPPC